MRYPSGVCVIMALLAACGGGEDGSGPGNGITPPPPPPPAITVSTSSSTAMVAQGASGTIPITVTRLNGAAGAITLAAEGLPANVTAVFTPNPIADGATTSTVTVSVGDAAAVGTSTITVRATAPGVAAQTATAQLVVTAAIAPDYLLRTAVDSGNISLTAGQTFSLPVTVTRLGGFTGSVTLVLDGAPTGVTTAFAPNPVTGTTATLAIGTNVTVAVGTYTVRVRGVASGLADRTTASFRLVITPPLTLTLTATNVTVAQGAVGASAVTITRPAGFTGPVQLSTTNVPANVTVSFDQNPTTASNVVLLFAVGANATPGTYTVTLGGLGTGLAMQSTTLVLVVTTPGGGGNLAWRFCDPARLPVWFAFRDGTAGPWTRVMAGTNNTFTFNVAQDVGAVAYVQMDGADTNVEVLYGSRLDLQNFLAQECLNSPAPGKSLFGSVLGLATTEVADVYLGDAESSVSFGAPTYRLDDVASGALDLFGVRWQATAGPPPTTTPNRMVLQRNVNVAAGGTLPVLDFNGAQSFAPATSTITLANAGADQLFFGNVVVFASGTEANYVPQPLASGITRRFFGIPTALLAPGDVHAALVVASSTSAPEQRVLYSYFRTVEDRTLTLGPTLGPVTVSSSTAGGLARPRARANIQSEYARAFGATFIQNNGRRMVSISAYRDFFAAGASEFELETPNFAGLEGFNMAWGLVPGAVTEAQVSAIGGTAVGAMMVPGDGSFWRLAARSVTFVP